MERGVYPCANNERKTISHLLPKLSEDEIDEGLDLLLRSSVIDGADIRGHGIVSGHGYGWRMVIETRVKSIAVVPDKFFDIRGRSYPIDQFKKVSVSSLPDYINYKDAIIYKINSKPDLTPPRAEIIFDDAMEGGVTAHIAPPAPRATTETSEPNVLVQSYPYRQNRTFASLFGTDSQGNPYIEDQLGSIYNIHAEPIEICEADYLAIIVDSNDEYFALLGQSTTVDQGDLDDAITWGRPKTPINVYQFKNIDMWLRFESINALAYFLITKYEKNIQNIIPVSTDPTTIDPDDWAVNRNITEVTKGMTSEAYQKQGKIWAYIDPKTMKPYADDYWFHEGEPYLIKSLTLAPKGKRIKGNKITVRANEWPGMYMLVGETFIRSRDTNKDEHMQISFPMCKIRSDHTLTLEADGEPTVFNLNLEVATPKNGIMMELVTYETGKKMVKGENGCFYAVDGSTEVLSE